MDLLWHLKGDNGLSQFDQMSCQINDAKSLLTSEHLCYDTVFMEWCIYYIYVNYYYAPAIKGQGPLCLGYIYLSCCHFVYFTNLTL